MLDRKRVKTICFAAWLWAGVFFPLSGKTCMAAETPVLPPGCELSLWQADESGIKVTLEQTDEEIEIKMDPSAMNGEYEQIVLNMASSGLFALDENEAVTIRYRYEGEKPLYLQLTLNDIYGAGTKMQENVHYGELAAGRIWLREGTKGMICINPGDAGTLVFLPSDMEGNGADLLNLYGITLTLLAEKQEECTFRFEGVKKESGKIIERLRKRPDLSIEGTEVITVPYMGTSWYEYRIQGDNAENIVFLDEELPKGCSMEPDGRFTVEEDAFPGLFEVAAMTEEGFYLKKSVTLYPVGAMGYHFPKPEVVKKGNGPLEFFSAGSVLFFLRLALFLTLAGTAVLLIWVRIRIWKDEKAAKEEEMF